MGKIQGSKACDSDLNTILFPKDTHPEQFYTGTRNLPDITYKRPSEGIADSRIEQFYVWRSIIYGIFRLPKDFPAPVLRDFDVWGYEEDEQSGKGYLGMVLLRYHPSAELKTIVANRLKLGNGGEFKGTLLRLDVNRTPPSMMLAEAEKNKRLLEDRLESIRPNTISLYYNKFWY